MKKWLLISIIVLIIAAYASMQEVNYLNEPSTCMDCHTFKHEESSLQQHFNKSITCIDCHSGSGVKGYVEARKELLDVILLEKSKTVLNFIIQNYSYNSSFVHLATNCTKCHSLNEPPGLSETGSLKKMEIGGHRNKTCEDCHSRDFRIPGCIDCHKPHKENEKTGNSVCLDCHNSPHVPVRNGTFNTRTAKEECGVCHEVPYKTLAFYNSKHNQFKSCVNCHPAHKEKKKCFSCHGSDHLSHPYARNNCSACHGKAVCIDCHKYPHAPDRGLARISSNEQLNDYASAKRR